jgi:hypothetical protein
MWFSFDIISIWSAGILLVHMIIAFCVLRHHFMLQQLRALHVPSLRPGAVYGRALFKHPVTLVLQLARSPVTANHATQHSTGTLGLVPAAPRPTTAISQEARLQVGQQILSQSS